MSQTRRLFFALPLPAPLQQQIVQWRAEQFPADTGRLIEAANLHLTLAFLGDVSEPKAQKLAQLATAITPRGFDVQLDNLGHWLAPGVIWLGCQRAPHALLSLADMLRAQAARQGCYIAKQSFHPHVSLLRAIHQPLSLPAKTPSWRWQARQFTLYHAEFRRGKTHYQPLQSWAIPDISS
jgi:2'-5' RNA ligase